MPSTTLRLVGLSLLVAAAGMVVSAGVQVLEGGPGAGGLVASGLIVGVVGAAVFDRSEVPGRQHSTGVFSAVAWSWVLASVAGALPFLLTGAIPWRDADLALFESVSGFTTTGATILADIEALPRGLLFWRSLSQWFGGMGLIVLAVAVLPALKVGGLELIAAEAPGPTADRLTPRVSETARRLWLLYAGATVVTTIALLAAGADLYDSVIHALTTIASGGFSPYNDSIGHFDSAAIELVVVAGMLFTAANFSLHWQAIRTRSLRGYLAVSEMRVYLGIFAGLAATLAVLNAADVELARNVRDAVFTAATIATSTGFSTADFALWGASAQVLLVLVMLSGGMAGSTSGSMKIMRVQVLVRSAMREVVRTLHPRAVLKVRLGATPVPEEIVARVTGFVFLYLGLIVVGGTVVALLGTPPVEAYSGALSAIGNIGPAIGDAGPAGNWLVFDRPSRVVLMALMLAGRLEVFPMLLMFAAASRTARRRRWRATRSGARSQTLGRSGS